MYLELCIVFAFCVFSDLFRRTELLPPMDDYHGKESIDAHTSIASSHPSPFTRPASLVSTGPTQCANVAQFAYLLQHDCLNVPNTRMRQISMFTDAGLHYAAKQSSRSCRPYPPSPSRGFLRFKTYFHGPHQRSISCFEQLHTGAWRRCLSGYVWIPIHRLALRRLIELLVELWRIVLIVR